MFQILGIDEPLHIKRRKVIKPYMVPLKTPHFKLKILLILAQRIMPCMFQVSGQYLLAIVRHHFSRLRNNIAPLSAGL